MQNVRLAIMTLVEVKFGVGISVIGMMAQTVAVKVQMADTIFFDAKIIKQIKFDFLKPECGAILGSRDGDNYINAYCFDKSGSNSANANEYRPNIEFLNKALDGWKQNHILFIGLLHSHPIDKSTLSTADVNYAKQICWFNQIQYVNMFIYIPCHDIYGYKVTENGSVLLLSVQ